MVDQTQAGGADDEIARLTAELEQARSLLTEERAYFAEQLRAGAAELADRDALVERVRAKRDRAVRQRDRARAELDRVRRSRLVRLALRLSAALRPFRGRA